MALLSGRRRISCSQSESAAFATKSARVLRESAAPAMPALPKALRLSRNLYLTLEHVTLRKIRKHRQLFALALR